MAPLALSPLEFLFPIVLLLLGTLYFQKGKWKKCPPGPLPLPLLGNVFQIGTIPHLRFTEWAKKYGPVVKLKLGTLDSIVITDVKLIKELFADAASSGRFINAVTTEFSKGPYGVINAEGPHWEVQRRFTLRKLRDFGFAKTTMEGIIMEEVHATLQWFRERAGSPISGNRIFNAPVVNTLFHIVSGERFEWENGVESEIIRCATSFFEGILQITANGLMFAPFLRHLAPDLLGWTRYVAIVDRMRAIFEGWIEKHKETLDPSNPRDFLDHMLIEISQTTDPTSSFYKELGHTHLVAGIYDLFEAGSETTANTLSWSLLFLSTHPKVEEKLYAEIESVVGLARSPSLADRCRMPYTEAFVAETLRRSAILAAGVPHKMLAERELAGYTIPKGCIVMANIYGVHHDPQVWEEPHTFKPERHLSDNGTKFVRHEALIPFAAGKRECIGAGMAKDTLFLFISSIVQQFLVQRDPGSKGKPDFGCQEGLLNVPNPFTIMVVPRD